MDENLIAQFKNYTILCVEDEDGIRKRLVNTLKYYFKDVLEANNGEDGYDLYLEYEPQHATIGKNSKSDAQLQMLRPSQIQLHNSPVTPQ